MSNTKPDALAEALALLKEARTIIRASASRNLAKDWDRRATELLGRKAAPVKSPS